MTPDDAPDEEARDGGASQEPPEPPDVAGLVDDAPPPAEQREAARDFLSLLADGDFVAAAGRYHPLAGMSVAPEDVEADWRGFEDDLGAFEGIEGVEVDAERDVTLVTAGFAGGETRFLVEFAGNGDVLSFRAFEGGAGGEEAGDRDGGPASQE